MLGKGSASGCVEAKQPVKNTAAMKIIEKFFMGSLLGVAKLHNLLVRGEVARVNRFDPDVALFQRDRGVAVHRVGGGVDGGLGVGSVLTAGEPECDHAAYCPSNYRQPTIDEDQRSCRGQLLPPC